MIFFFFPGEPVVRHLVYFVEIATLHSIPPVLLEHCLLVHISLFIWSSPAYFKTNLQYLKVGLLSTTWVKFCNSGSLIPVFSLRLLMNFYVSSSLWTTAGCLSSIIHQGLRIALNWSKPNTLYQPLTSNHLQLLVWNSHPVQI